MLDKNKILNLIKKTKNFNLKEIEKNKFYLFITISFVATIIVHLYTYDFSTLVYPLLFVLLVYFNKENYNLIKKVKRIERIIGTGIIIFSLICGFIITESFNFPELVIFLIGISVLFYGFFNLRKVYLPPTALLTMFFLIIVLFKYELYIFASPLNPILASFTANLLSFFGYPIKAIGSRIIIEKKMTLVVSEECTGIWGMLIYSSLATVLILGLKSSPIKKLLCIIGGIIGIFIINIIRIPILTLIAYYYDRQTLQFWHAHLGEFLWIPFIAFYWYISFKYILKEKEEKNKIKEKPIPT